MLRHLSVDPAANRAVRRKLYPSPLPTTPSVMVIDVALRFRGEHLPLGRYYPIIVETNAEREELERHLEDEEGAGFPPDLLDHRASNLVSDRILISRFDPPAPGWPWVSVTRWPDSFRDAAADHGVSMARGCYTMELFLSDEALEAHSAMLLDGLGSHYPINVRLLSPDTLGAAGRA